MSDVANALDLALGKVQEVAATDHEKVAEHAHSEASDAFRALIDRVKATDPRNQQPVLLAGLSDAFKSAAAEGPSVVRHLATELRAVALESFFVEGAAQ